MERSVKTSLFINKAKSPLRSVIHDWSIRMFYSILFYQPSRLYFQNKVILQQYWVQKIILFQTHWYCFSRVRAGISPSIIMKKNLGDHCTFAMGGHTAVLINFRVILNWEKLNWVDLLNYFKSFLVRQSSWVCASPTNRRRILFY